MDRRAARLKPQGFPGGIRRFWRLSMSDVLIPTNRPGLFAIVDAEDEALVLAHRWHVMETVGLMYARTMIPADSGQRSLLMHQLIHPDLSYIDHKDGNGLNNRRANLRPATHAQNMQNRGRQRNNTSGFKGVSIDKETGRWMARIYCDGRPIRLGGYATPEEAGMAYDEAALIHHGEFARLNFPMDQLVVA